VSAAVAGGGGVWRRSAGTGRGVCKRDGQWFEPIRLTLRACIPFRGRCRVGGWIFSLPRMGVGLVGICVPTRFLAPNGPITTQKDFFALTAVRPQIFRST
jgi:hypothetical protein